MKHLRSQCPADAILYPGTVSDAILYPGTVSDAARGSRFQIRIDSI